MDLPTWLVIVLFVVIIFLLCFSAFFSSAETAFTTVSVPRLKSMADDKIKGAKKAVYIAENTNKTLIAILIGNNFVNICSTTLCALVFGALIANPTISNVLNTVVMTIIVLIFGEILPKTLASKSPEKLSLKFSGFMYGYMKILTPLVFIFSGIQKLFSKKDTKVKPTVTEDELENIIDTMEEEGVIESQDADLIQGVLDIQEKTAYDIMTARVDIVGIDISDENMNQDAILQVFMTSNYSRLPVYQQDKDHIIGILNYKDFSTAYLKKENIDVKGLLLNPISVSENMKVDEILRLMQKEKQHMCIVVDEHGGTSGLVTFEDTIEEVVGEVYDEHDMGEDIKPEIVKTGENTYILPAEMDIKELFDFLEIEHLPKTDYSQIAGLIYEQLNTLPEIGEKVSIFAVDDKFLKDGSYEERTKELIFTILEIEDSRVKKVELKVLDVTEQAKSEKISS